jgi:hypothetical protein
MVIGFRGESVIGIEENPHNRHLGGCEAISALKRANFGLIAALWFTAGFLLYLLISSKTGSVIGASAVLAAFIAAGLYFGVKAARRRCW